MRYYKMREAVKLLGLHPNTIRKYEKEGIIKAIRNKAGQRLLDVESYLGYKSKARTICYCRVSSGKQKDDLARQVVYMQEQFPDAEIIQDIGSGINFKRKGLNSILESAIRGDKCTVIVAHRDRLARFGVELIEFVLGQHGGKLLVLDKTVHSPEQELTQDLLSILTVFSCRMHGLRSYCNKIKDDKALLNGGTESKD